MHSRTARCTGNVEKIATKTAGDKKLLFETLSAFEVMIFLFLF
jgi:hypothetical protein